jgi:hypothetical protein
MPLSRTQAFQQMRKSLELRPPEETTVAERQRRIRDLVSERLTVTEDFLTGSYARHTLIGPLQSADVDIVLVLESSLRSKGPRGVLDAVRQVLKAEYTRSDISRNGQAVTVQFTDFAVDVVPAFSVSAWNRFWNNSGPLQICNAGSHGWIDTDPRKHVAISSTANQAHAGHLVPRVKQLKAWNRAAGSPLHSFHLEVLAWSIFGNSSSNRHLQESDWVTARYFFQKARAKCPDPREVSQCQ